MKRSLTRLEAHLEHIVEGTLARLLAGRLHPREVAIALARAMEDNAREGAAPTRFVVRLNPADAETLLAAPSQPDLEAAFADELVELARETGLSLADRPTVHLIAAEEVAPHQAVVEVDHTPALADTGAITPLGQSAPRAESAPPAYLIVDGTRHVPLRKPVVGIGRRLDNDIILDDPRVSRLHAQMRQRYGRWVIYDLDSRGGTWVNNQRVEECVLRPGDVVSLAGAALIYGEEEPGAEPPAAEEAGGTRPIPSEIKPDAPTQSPQD